MYRKAIPGMVGSRVLMVDLEMVPLVVSSMQKEMGSAMERIKIL